MMTQRTHTVPEFLEETFATCIDEYVGSEEEEEALSEFYEECVDEVYGHGDGDCDPEDQWYFWLLLVLAIVFGSAAFVFGLMSAYLYSADRNSKRTILMLEEDLARTEKSAPRFSEAQAMNDQTQRVRRRMAGRKDSRPAMAKGFY